MSTVSFLNLLEPSRRAGYAGRLLAFHEGKLSTNEAAVLLQEVLETGHIAELPLNFRVAALHFVDAGLCTVNGRMLQ